jgi:glycogenin glucosyltransferase
MTFDVLQVMQNCDDLFDRPEISATKDTCLPTCFHDGVFVFIPSKNTYDSLVNFAIHYGNFKGLDHV